jgi:hypothetical protein
LKKRAAEQRSFMARQSPEGSSGTICDVPLRRVFAQTEYASMTFKICWAMLNAKPGVTKVYARATLTVLEDAVDKLIEPWGEVIKFERRAS